MTVSEDDLIFSAYKANSSELFPLILDLHVDEDVRIADVTHGKGVFWQDIDLDERNIELLTSDIKQKRSDLTFKGDCRYLQYKDNSLDCIIFDPPYAEGYYRRHEGQLAGNGSHRRFRDAYSVDRKHNGSSKYHQAVLDMYFEGGKEAKRVLRPGGTLIIKIMDEVSSNKQELTHIQVANFYERKLECSSRDLFVQIRKEVPTVTGMNSQVHARKNHSYFMVFDLP